MSVSVVVPTLNEARNIEACLASAAEADEIIVVDGGSVDTTVAIARATGARVIEGTQGRGAQLAQGAKGASGNWIAFLHADTRLGLGWKKAIEGLDESFAGGAFRLCFDSPRFVYRAMELGVLVRTLCFRLPYGDQCIFARKQAYLLCGGIPHVPLMEDVVFVRALGGLGRLAFPSIHAVTSARRFEERGPLRTALGNMMRLARFAAGADPHLLAANYAARRPISDSSR